MTGLDAVNDVIIEVAVVVTDINFKTLEEYHQVVHQPQEKLDGMDDWCKKTHGDSGLSAAVPTGKPLEKVEDELLDLIKRHYDTNDRVIIAGNSVGNDKMFIDRTMPRFSKKLHYRIIDISSFKEVFKSKYKIEFKKKNSHRALDDIYESIRELECYLSHVTPSHSTQAQQEKE